MRAKARQTFEKMNRERAVKEKRARKQEKKEQRKLAAQAAPTEEGAPEPRELEDEEQRAAG